VIGAHQAAVTARLRENAKLANKVHDGIRVSDDGARVRENAVAVAAFLPGIDERRLTDAQSPLGDTFLYVKGEAVAVDYPGLLLLLDAIREQMSGHPLVVTGRAVTPFEVTIDEPVFDRASRMWVAPFALEANTSRAVA
jgi:hypothetical protein